MTYKELRDIVNNMTEEQLEKNIYVNYGLGFITDKLSIMNAAEEYVQENADGYFAPIVPAKNINASYECIFSTVINEGDTMMYAPIFK